MYTQINNIYISVAGLWAGFLICVLIQSIFFTLYLYKLNWKKATEEVSNSAGKGFKGPVFKIKGDQFVEYGRIGA